MKRSDLLWFLGRVFVGGVFAYAGFTKLMEPAENFRAAILQYGVIPYEFAAVIAWILPWIEFLFGVFFILGYATRPGALVLGLTSLSFLLVLGASHVLLDSGPSDCGCFGQGAWIHLSSRQVFFLDLVMLALNLRLFFLKEHLFSLDRLIRKV